MRQPQASPARRRAARRPRPGQALVVIALMQLVLLGSLGLALDGGYTYAQRRAMQSAADAAALAGADVVALDSGSGASYPVLATVRDVAQRNGVPDVASNVDCWYINDSLAAVKDGGGNDAACTNGAIPAGTSGVQVSVRETHATFVMRALGIPRTGTRATAAARVEYLNDFWPGPFAVCGVDTALAPNSVAWTGPDGTTGIFRKLGVHLVPRLLGYSGCGPSGNYPCGRAQESTDIPPLPLAPTSGSEAVLNNDGTRADGGYDSLFYYDFSREKPLEPIDHNPGKSPNKSSEGPTFQIHGPDSTPVERCNITSSGFKGINTTIYTSPVRFPYGRDYSPPMIPVSNPALQIGTPMALTPGNVASVSTTVNGPYGCVKGQPINNCVLLLPIIDSSGPGGESPGGGAVTIAVRKFMYFWVQETQSGNAHTGRLIKNYRALGPGMPGWIPGSTDPLVIRLVK